MFALDNVRIALNYDDISAVIHNNSDYIAHHINLAIKKVSLILIYGMWTASFNLLSIQNFRLFAWLVFIKKEYR